jgi:ABC-type long-subunit fatty acid transport system fused permease/ATPase subunit
MSNIRTFLVLLVWFIIGALSFELFNIGLHAMNQSDTALFYIGILMSILSIVSPIYLAVKNPGLRFKK